MTGGPPSMGTPLPLKMRPSMSSDTGVFNTSPVNSHAQGPTLAPLSAQLEHAGPDNRPLVSST